MTALAGLVPCAEVGIRQTSRWLSPFGGVVGADDQHSPAYSPCEPALGCSDTAANPVISQQVQRSSRRISSR